MLTSSSETTKTSETDISLRQHSLDGFSKTMQQFLNAVSGVFPECVETRKSKLKFEIGITHGTDAIANPLKKTLIERWHTTKEPMYERCKARDETVIKELCADSSCLASKMKLWDKWNDSQIQDGTHNIIWAYIDNLNKFCQMYILYSKVPDKMMNSIQNMATTIASGAAAPGDMMQMGKEICQNLDENEMRSFAETMMSNMKSLSSLCSSFIPGFAGQLSQAATQVAPEVNASQDKISES